MLTFRDALLRHMLDHNTTIAELSRGTGVSEGLIKKLRTREGGSTSAEVAMRIASFYGKTLEAFVSEGDEEERDRLAAMLDLLTEDERRILAAQIRGLIRDR